MIVLVVVAALALWGIAATIVALPTDRRHRVATRPR